MQSEQRQQFWAAVDAGYAALRADPSGWAAEQSERGEWDGALADGLDQTERWGDDGCPLPSSRPGHG
jgi:hypothetical protein